MTQPPDDKPPVDEEYVGRTRATGFATMREAFRAAYAYEAAKQKDRLSAAERTDDASLTEREEITAKKGQP